MRAYPEMDDYGPMVALRQEDVLFDSLGPRLWCLITWCSFYEHGKDEIKLNKKSGDYDSPATE